MALALKTCTGSLNLTVQGAEQRQVSRLGSPGLSFPPAAAASAFSSWISLSAAAPAARAGLGWLIAGSSVSIHSGGRALAYRARGLCGITEPSYSSWSCSFSWACGRVGGTLSLEGVRLPAPKVEVLVNRC